MPSSVAPIMIMLISPECHHFQYHNLEKHVRSDKTSGAATSQASIIYPSTFNVASTFDAIVNTIRLGENYHAKNHCHTSNMSKQ